VHARIVIEQGSARIEDLGSTDGTYLNGDRITKSALKDGDKLRFGGSVFRVHWPTPEPSAQDDIATVLSSEDSIRTHLGAETPEALGAAETRLARGAKQPGSRSLPDTAHGAPPAVPPPAPPVVPPPPPQRSGRAFPWKVVLIGLAVVVAIGVVISLGVILLGGGEETASEFVPEGTISFDAPTPLPTQAPVIPPPSTLTVNASTDTQQAPTLEEPPTPAATANIPTEGIGQDQIAFASDRSGRPQIYLVNVEGGEPLQLTGLPDGACQPAWSPDGIALAFTSPCTGNREEYVGSSIFVMQVGADGAATAPMPLILSLSGGSYDPAWSPDGSKIAFTSQRTGRSQIFVAGADGSNPVNLNNDLAFNWSPTWSPDGEQLAFLTGRSGQEEVWLISSSGGEETRFTRGDGKDIARPSWSPDGATIVFEKVIGNISRLSDAPIADGGVRELQVCQAGALSLQPMGEPGWSPDGMKLTFETWPGGVDHNIAVMNLGCTGYTELTSDDALDFDPAWRPAR